MIGSDSLVSSLKL